MHFNFKHELDFPQYKKSQEKACLNVIKKKLILFVRMLILKTKILII